jgi:hypothetical protein
MEFRKFHLAASVLGLLVIVSAICALSGTKEGWISATDADFSCGTVGLFDIQQA